VKGGQYFIIKNSFGKSWGDSGYAKISAHNIDEPEGTCGILANLYQPSLKKT
jgi:C1A family cysteine protease